MNKQGLQSLRIRAWATVGHQFKSPVWNQIQDRLGHKLQEQLRVGLWRPGLTRMVMQVGNPINHQLQNNGASICLPPRKLKP